MTLIEQLEDMKQKEQKLYVEGEEFFNKHIKPYLSEAKSKDDYISAIRKFRRETYYTTDFPDSVKLELGEIRMTMRRNNPELWTVDSSN